MPDYSGQVSQSLGSQQVPPPVPAAADIANDLHQRCTANNDRLDCVINALREKIDNLTGCPQPATTTGTGVDKTEPLGMLGHISFTLAQQSDLLIDLQGQLDRL